MEETEAASLLLDISVSKSIEWIYNQFLPCRCSLVAGSAVFGAPDYAEPLKESKQAKGLWLLQYRFSSKILLQSTVGSLDDVRMNLEVLKYCATVLFLESSLPDIFTENSWVSPNAITRSRSNRNSSGERTGKNTSTLSSSVKVENHSVSSPPTHRMEEIHPILLLAMHNTGELVEADPENTGPFNMGVFNDIVGKEPFPSNTMGEEKTSSSSQESSNAATLPEACNRQTDFFEPDDISIHSLSVTFAPFYGGTQKIQILHENCPLQLWCKSLKVQFGISTKFVDHAGRPRLNIVR